MTNIIRSILAAALLVSGAPAFPSGLASMTMEPAQIRVGIAKVRLEVADLVVEPDRIRGHYAIKIPLAPIMNDFGDLDLRLDQPMERLVESGGIVRGTGRSREDGRTHPVTCHFATDGTVRISIDNGRRVLDFETRFAGGTPAQPSGATAPRGRALAP